MDMNTAIARLVEDIKTDYYEFTRRGASARLSRARGENLDVDDQGFTAINRSMIAEFNDSISVVEGKKYAKIVKNGSVWGFVVTVDNDKKFPKGTILKAASWNAPARNHSRGNVLEGGYCIHWTGPHYI